MEQQSMEFSILFILSGFELILHLVELPISAINLFLVGRTPLLHPNLKFVLIYQSLWIFLRGFARSIICVLKFVLADPLASEQFQPWRFVYQLSSYNRNFVPHVLIIERIIATRMAGSYERRRGWHFSAVWSTIVFLISLYNALSTSSTNTSIYGLITTLSLLVLGIVEFLLFVWLWRYNEKVYKQSLQKKLHSLTEKYQLSENIRIGKQLTPTLLLQLLSVLVTSAYLTTSNFRIQFYPNIMVLVTVTLTTFFAILIEITMITCHPFLKRDFCAIMKHLGHFARCCHGSRVESEQNAGIAMKDIINGENLMEGPMIRDHFDMLKESWDRGLLDKKN